MLVIKVIGFKLGNKNVRCLVIQYLRVMNKKKNENEYVQFIFFIDEYWSD